MTEINPIAHLYSDIITILNSLTIKYSVKADKYETMDVRSKGDRYLNALLRKDTYFNYDDYSVADFNACGITDLTLITSYMNDRFSVPSILRSQLLEVRRDREISEYEEGNNYYRILNGYPELEDKDFIYVRSDYCEAYGIPEDVPIHLIEDKEGYYFITVLEGLGYIDELIAKYPDKEYLKHIGSNRVTIKSARNAKNFAILKVQQDNIMESTYREFVRSYEKARNYFMSVCYNIRYREVIPYYDNFIAMCIFIMAIQQVSMRAIQNATDREFYDEYMVQMLYETYGLPYFSKVDGNTQKQIVQNINLMIQNKATNKVIIDMASLLGFTDITIYQYYLMKKRKFDKNGRPIIAKKQQINTSTGKEETVYNTEEMYSVYFQKVDIQEENVKEALTDTLNRVEYSDITYYDPFWWEDDELHSQIWDLEYNYAESKYMGITTPYRMTDILFQSIILMRIIMEKQPELWNVTLQLPKITDKEVKLSDAVILFFALMAKKLGISGQILTLPSKLVHVLEVNDQEINKENEHIEVLGFNFDAFKPENVKKTLGILEKYLARRKYRVVNGHDVDLLEDGTQDKSGPTHKIQWTIEETDLQEFYAYITQLTIPEGTPESKVAALNKIYENIQCLYWFLSYQMSVTNNVEEYYALKKFYDVAFYSKETAEFFTFTDEDGVSREAETFDEYFYYTNQDLYQFIQNVDKDLVYTYIDHIIYKMEQLLDDIGTLYILNDGFSPLMELLQILVEFLKAYQIDFVDMKSLMIVDWEMENTIRFFSHPQHIQKLNQIEEEFGKEFSDLVNKFLCHYSISDQQELYDYIAAQARIHIEEPAMMANMLEVIRMAKVDQIHDAFDANDTLKSLHVTQHVSDEFNLKDYCIKK